MLRPSSRASQGQRSPRSGVPRTFASSHPSRDLLVQLASGTASWMPTTLTSVLSGVAHELSRPAAVFGLALWALVPTIAGLLAVHRRDVV